MTHEEIMLQEFAKREAIQFAEWIRSEGYESDEGFSNKWRRIATIALGTVIYHYQTTAQLYQQFKEERRNAASNGVAG